MRYVLAKRIGRFGVMNWSGDMIDVKSYCTRHDIDEDTSFDSNEALKSFDSNEALKFTTVKGAVEYAIDNNLSGWTVEEYEGKSI
jgi:hypothetical protein